MTENQKVDELVQKLRSLGQRVRSTRESFGEPITGRLFDRLNKLSSRIPQANGDSHSQPQPSSLKAVVVCPRCGRSYTEGVNFCDKCGFDFRAQESSERREREAEERLERLSKLGVVPP